MLCSLFSGEQYRKTEICQTCSKIKNLCQTCILDLEFNLPSQLRDAVLAQGDSTLVVPESDANREYFAAQHTQMVAEGTDPWSARETPTEKLLQMMRNVGQDRAQPRIKLAALPSKRDARYVHCIYCMSLTAGLANDMMLLVRWSLMLRRSSDSSGRGLIWRPRHSSSSFLRASPLWRSYQSDLCLGQRRLQV